MMTHNPTDPPHPPNTARPARGKAITVGLLLFAVYLLVYRGGFHSVDEVSMFAVTESLVKFGRATTDQIAWTQWTTTQAEAQGFFGRGGHVYSKKGLALSLAQAPLYWLALQIPGLGMLQTVSLLNAIITALTGSLVWLFTRRLGFSPGVALLTALTYGLATIAFVYAKYLFSEPLAGFLLLLAAYMLFAYRQEGGLRHIAIAGLAAGFAVLTRANNLFLLPLFGLYLLVIVANPIPHPISRGLRPLLAFAAALAVPGLILLTYNAIRSGNPFQTGYDLSLFTPNVALGLYKLLFSPLRGLFVYSPVLILSLPGWWVFRRRHPAEAWLFAGLVGVTLGLFSAWSSGEGLSWGSRFLVPVVPFLVLWLTPILPALLQPVDLPRARLVRGGLALLLSLSAAIQLLGVAINPWVFLARLQADFGGEFFLENTPALYSFRYSQIVGQLQTWSLQNSDLAWLQPWGFDGLAFSLSLGLVALAVWLVWRGGPPRRLRLLAPLFALVPLLLLARYHTTDRQFGPPDDPYTRALLQAEQQAAPGDRFVTVAPYHYHVPMNRFKPRRPIIGFAQQVWPPPDTALPLLNNALTGPNVWLVTVGFPPASPDNAAEQWLVRHAYKAADQWLDDVRLVRFGTRPPTSARPVGVTLGRRLMLTHIRLTETAFAGQVLPVALEWQVANPPETDYNLFLQLLAADGLPVAQHDSPPNGGYSPATDWRPGQTVILRHGLALPPDLSPGDYRLITGLYNPATGQRLTTTAGQDFIDLGVVRVEVQ